MCFQILCVCEGGRERVRREERKVEKRGGWEIMAEGEGEMLLGVLEQFFPFSPLGFFPTDLTTIQQM